MRDHRAGRLHPQRACIRCRSRRATSPARCCPMCDRLPAPGAGRPRAGRRHVVPVEPVRLRRPGRVDARSRRNRARAAPFNVMSFHSGGTGARPGKDGLSATAFPSGVRNVPVEVTEAMSPHSDPAQGIPHRFRRPRRVPRRPRPGDGGRHARRRAVRHQRQLRPRRLSRRAAATAAATAWPASCCSRSGRKLRGKGQQTVAAATTC